MHPIVFSIEIFGKTINFYSYGMMLMISFLVGWAGSYYLFSKDGYDEERALRGLVGATLGALVMARILYGITNGGTFAPEFPISVVNFKKYDGMVAYGGYIGGFLGSYLVIKKYGWRWMQYADCASPFVATGLAITRIGCFLAGCDYGKPTDLPWGVEFPEGSYAFNRHVREGLLGPDATQSLPVHPTQFYESLAGVIIFAILFYLHRRRRKYGGFTFAWFLILYGAFRFLNEFIRGDAGRGALLGVSTSQWIAIFTVAWAVWILRRQFPLQSAAALKAGVERAEGKKSGGPAAPGGKKKGKKKRK